MREGRMYGTGMGLAMGYGLWVMGSGNRSRRRTRGWALTMIISSRGQRGAAQRNSDVGYHYSQ